MPQEARQEAPKIATGREVETESLRLTAFLAPSEQPSDPKWWVDLVGTEPETRTSKPGRGELQEAGPFGGYTLTLSVQPGRVDWFLTPRLEEGDLPSPANRVAGPFQKTVEAFVPLMTRWLENSPGLVRLALGVVVHEIVQERIAGYRKLAQYLPAVKIDPEHSSDFSYQINRPRNSAVIDPLRINRLSKWSVASFVPMRIIVSKQQVVQQPVGPEQQSVRIELDLSTDAAFVGELPKPQLPRLLIELEGFALELVSQGDIP